jgi:cell division septation protein DedD
MSADEITTGPKSARHHQRGTPAECARASWEPTPEKPSSWRRPSSRQACRGEDGGKPVAETPPPAEAKPKGKFTVQVGSYQSSEEATASLANWKKKGYSAFMAVGSIPNKGTWYRVRIGGFPSREEAQKFLEKFKTKEKASALVVLSNS